MAIFETTILVDRPPATTFAFVSDFRNAARWDPRTYAVEKTTPGPVGMGTRFMLTGGMLPENVVSRLHIPERLAGMPLPYDVVEFEPPRRFVLEGESPIFRYRDELEFETEAGGTRLRYLAELRLKGILAAGEPVLRLMFGIIGRDATRDLAAAVHAGTSEELSAGG